jgi:hypothetical protein
MVKKLSSCIFCHGLVGVVATVHNISVVTDQCFSPLIKPLIKFLCCLWKIVLIRYSKVNGQRTGLKPSR